MENPFKGLTDQLMAAIKPKDKDDTQALAEIVTSGEATLSAIDAVLTQRGKRYGTFKSNSIVYDDLIKVFEASPNWHSAPPEVRHACHNIATKLARLLTGEVMYDDNWTDIAGYATLMAKICRGEAS